MVDTGPRSSIDFRSRAGLRRRNHDETYEVCEWGGVCHDSDHHVLLEIELSRVETPGVSEGGELPGREDRFQKFSGRKSKKLRDVSGDGNNWLTNAKELVDKTPVKRSIGKWVLAVPRV